MSVLLNTRSGDPSPVVSGHLRTRHLSNAVVRDGSAANRTALELVYSPLQQGAEMTTGSMGIADQAKHRALTADVFVDSEPASNTTLLSRCALPWQSASDTKASSKVVDNG